KNAKNRRRDAGDVGVDIEQAIAEPVGSAANTADFKPRTTGRSRVLAGTVIGLITGAAFVFWMWSPWRMPKLGAPLRLSTEIGADVSLATSYNATLALSPDGAVLALVGEKNGTRQLYIRRLDQLQATPLAGTDGATDPFFSPDGQWIAFFANGKLKKVSVTGGAAITLCDAPNDRGGTWGEDGYIVFTPNNTAPTSLLRVSSGGG